jgi:hypothetical protein
MSTRKRKATAPVEPPEVTTEPTAPAETDTGTEIAAQKFVLTGPVGCTLTVNIHYVEEGSNPNEVKVLTKEFKGTNIINIANIISAGLRRLVGMIQPKGGYLVKIQPTKFVVQGFSDASGTYQHHRSMQALAGTLYLIMFGK